MTKLFVYVGGCNLYDPVLHSTYYLLCVSVLEATSNCTKFSKICI